MGDGWRDRGELVLGVGIGVGRGCIVDGEVILELFFGFFWFGGY